MNGAEALQIGAVIVSGLVGVGGLILAIVSASRNSKGDTAEQAEWRGRVSEKLDAIAKQLTGLVGIPERVTSLEKRVEALEKKGE